MTHKFNKYGSSWGNNGPVHRHNVVHMSLHSLHGLTGQWRDAHEYDLVFEPLPCRTEQDMSPEEIAEIYRAHGLDYPQELPR